MKRPVINLRSMLSSVFIAAGVLCFDQMSKLWVERGLDVNQSFHPIPALSGLFSITYVTNTGVAFGFFKEAGTFFIFLAILIIALLLYLFVRLDVNQRLARVALTLALSGVTGTLIDHLRLGHVIDFLDFKFWPIFNVADGAIVAGLVLLLVATWYAGRSRAGATPTPDA